MRAKSLTSLVIAARKPSSWVPPSWVLIGVGVGVDRLGVGGGPLHRQLEAQLALGVLDSIEMMSGCTGSAFLEATRWVT